MTKQKKRLVGMGMKPRSTAVNTAVSTEQEAPVQEVEVSKNSGQPEVVSETVQVWSDEKPNGGSLDLKPVQNLELAEGVISEVTGGDTVVAQKPVFEDVPLVTKSVLDDLEKMMAESKEAAGAETEKNEDKEKKLDAIVELIREEQRPRPYPEADGIPLEDHTWPTYGGIDRKKYAIGAELGELPNGEYRATVKIAEGYVEGVKQQSEADNMTMEEWLSLQLNERLEQWWGMPGINK